MWKNIILILIIVVLSSCGAKRKSVDEKPTVNETELGNTKVVSYKSLGNGVASISLELYKNRTFKFDFKSVPQPGTDEKPVSISENGTYTVEGDYRILNFKNPKFSLSAIFDAQFAGNEYFQVIDNENVKINTSKSALPIWGVICEKQ